MSLELQQITTNCYGGPRVEWRGLKIGGGTMVHQKVVFCIFRFQSIWVGTSAIIWVWEYSEKRTNEKTKSNLVSTAEIVETSETIAAGKRREALSSMIHDKIDALPRHSLLIDRCSITGQGSQGLSLLVENYGNRIQNISLWLLVYCCQASGKDCEIFQLYEVVLGFKYSVRVCVCVCAGTSWFHVFRPSFLWCWIPTEWLNHWTNV